MKNFLFLLFLLTVSSCQSQPEKHFAKEIAQLDKQAPIITANKSELITSWEKFVSFTIDKVEVVLENGQYFLKASSVGGDAKAMVVLVLDNNKLYEMVINGGGSTCVCKCKDTPIGAPIVGCDPSQPSVTNEWTCSACNGTCEKTVTATGESGSSILDSQD